MTRFTGLFASAAVLFFLSSCSESRHRQLGVNVSELTPDSVYVPTGLYLPADRKEKCIKMLQDQSDRVYRISEKPFVSVDDIIETRVQETKFPDGDKLTELCLTLNSKGKASLAQISGNSQYPQVAVVLAGRLTSVADVKSKITTGSLCISLRGYRRTEVDTINAQILRGL